MERKENGGVYWLKRDFRLKDNPALDLALRECNQLLILYIVEPTWLSREDTSTHHLHAIGQAFDGLQERMPAGTQLYFVEDEVYTALDKISSFFPFAKLFSHQETGVYWTYQRDISVSQWCAQNEVHWQEPIQTGVFRRLSNRDDRDAMWKEFYSKDIIEPPAPSILKAKLLQFDSDYLSTGSLQDYMSKYSLTKQKSDLLQTVSESAGLSTLKDFLYKRGVKYRGGISSPNTAMEACSRLSVHLAWGTLSPRYVYQLTEYRKKELKSSTEYNAGRWRGSLTAFQSRLHWRDHFVQRMESEPKMEFRALNPAYRNVVYSDMPDRMDAWTQGRTGFPLIDAVIRCLRETGYINFRMRAMITSFACHSLHLDWRKIHVSMAGWYTDYEPGIHFSQLQMQASVVGINTVRVYSPTKQLIDQDPDCLFVKKWIPELRHYAPADIIGHSTYSLGEYPGQIVHHKMTSKMMKDQIWSIKREQETKLLSQQVYLKHGSRKRPNRSKLIQAKPKKNDPQLKLDFGDGA